jgi:hypothetical protein
MPIKYPNGREPPVTSTGDKGGRDYIFCKRRFPGYPQCRLSVGGGYVNAECRFPPSKPADNFFDISFDGSRQRGEIIKVAGIGFKTNAACSSPAGGFGETGGKIAKTATGPP